MPPPKGDSQERPKPRRLFSFDSIKSSHSSRQSSSEPDLPKGARQELSHVLEDEDEGEGPPIHAPIPTKRSIFQNASEGSSTTSLGTESKRKLEPVRPIAVLASRSGSLDRTTATPSPPRARWENLRQHVLPSVNRPMSPPQRPPSAQSSHQGIPPRSTTPRPSRLARLGFKQVVEQAREAVDETRKFGEEIKRACALARYPDSKGGVLPVATGISSSSKMDYLRRPQSVSSLSLPSMSSASGSPSLRFLYQLLLNHPGPNEEYPLMESSLLLPYEGQVLSTLLCPFLTPTKYPFTKIEEERTIAIEAFELLSKSWQPEDEAASVERCLWCTKAVAAMHPSPARTRILGSLYRLIVPGDRNKILQTTQGFQSLASGLLLALVSLYRSSTGAIYANSGFDSGVLSPTSSFGFLSSNFKQPPHPDIDLIQDLIPHFLSGSFGELEDDRVEEVYGQEFGIHDRRHLAYVRRAVFLEALVSTIENSRETGEWLLCNVIEQFWPLPSFEVWTTLQAAIGCRKLNAFSRLSLAFLAPFLPRNTSASSSSPASTPSTPMQPTRMPSGSSSVVSLTPTTSYFQMKNVAVPSHIVSCLQSRVIPEAEALDGKDIDLDAKVVLETRIAVVRVLLELLCMDVVGEAHQQQTSSPKGDVFGTSNSRTFDVSELTDGIKPLIKWAIEKLAEWCRLGADSPWKDVLEKALRQIICGSWTSSIDILSILLRYLQDDVRKPLFAFLIPILNDQMVEDPPPYPYPPLTTLLTSLSRVLPPLFYKPLFACSASDKEVIVVNHLCTLQAHSKYVADYWLRDADMMSFALLGDAGGASAASPLSPSPSVPWGSVRLGQLILLVELIGKIQTARHLKDAAPPNGENAFFEAMRFVTSLEGRLTLMIEAKEHTALIQPSQRMLLCILFREIRLFTRSLKSASWITRSAKWLEAFFKDTDVGDLDKRVTIDVERVQGLYMAAQEGIQQSHKRHTSILAANVAKIVSAQSSDNSKTLDLAATFVEHRKLIDSLSDGYIPKALKLLVAISPLVSAEDYETLGPLLWEHCLLDNEDASLTASACFLLMQCAEKNPLNIQACIEVDLQHSDDLTRLEAVRKISIIVNWRFQILGQKFVSDRNHRPFKLARPPLPFVVADVGTSLYVQHESANEVKDKDDVPLELKRRLADLGWVEEDADAVDPRQELIKMPFSILPTIQLERLEVGITDIVAGAPGSPQPSPQPSPRKARGRKDQLHQPEDLATLLRRNSTSGGPASGVKRRAIFVPPLALIFPRLATLVFDPNFAVASAARATLLDLMRNDPSLLTRPIFDMLAGDHKNVVLAISSLTALLHVRRLLPPPMTHVVFNSLAGFLKYHAKTMDDPDCFRNFGFVAPIIASLAPQVSGMSIREIRRTKLEAFIIPSGALWFQTSSPKGPMFPRNIGTSSNPFDPLPPSLISITMIRVAQNMFFLSMLKRNPEDVHILRKTMSPLVLPSLDYHGPTKLLDLQDFIPQKRGIDPRPSSRNDTLEILSLMIARSYIPLVAQIFRSMPRHMSDRHELAILIDGLNRTLLEHGDDINIVSHVLIALMVASTRFRRLFTNGNGYALFMPALVKVYTEAPSHPGIRAAIEYSINRFYALHKESFLFQSISIIGQLSMSTIPDSDKEWFSKGVYDLFHSLKRGVTASIDVGGIHNANKSQEREALMLHTAEEKPQTFLAAIRRVESQAGTHVAVGLPDEFEAKRLSMDDFVRMFLTVIAHDLTISRAQHFLRLLLYLTPHLYNASAATRTILSDGISALGLILTKVFAKSKGGENIPKATREEDVSFIASELDSDESTKDKKPSAPTDSTVLRLDYIRLVHSFGSSGGQITLPLSRHVFDITRSLLKDWGEASTAVIASILSDFMKMLLHREEPALPKAIVAFLLDLSPVLENNLLTVDFTGVYDTILKLAETPTYANDPAFSKVVVEGMCRAVLRATDTQLANLPYRPVLISLFAESIFLRNVDVIGELEKKPPTYTYLTSIILPLTLVMKTENHVVGDGLRGEQHRSALTSAWIRILFYVMTACQQSRKDETSSRHLRGLAGLRSKTQTDKGRQETAFWHSHLPTFMSALQVIKVVIVRGASDISSLTRIGVWERLAAFFRTMLDEGSAEFTLLTESSSTTTTPAGSPRNSGQFDPPSSPSRNFSSRTSYLNRSPSLGADLNRSFAFNRPRIVDYCLWSILEFVCAYRSPLRMHLKLFTIEKVVALDQELQHLSTGSPQLGGLSPVSPSRASRRVSTSIFSKARQRGSLSPSPNSSPYLAPSSPIEITSSPSFLEIPTRRPGYQISPVSPREPPFGMPKIVHLGPTSPSAFHPMTSPLIGGGIKVAKDDGGEQGQQKLAKVVKIKSAKLIQETYRRIRGVQTFMGYDLLLPMASGAGLINTPDMKIRDEDAVLETWSKAEALAAIVKETKDLLEEFQETFTVDEDSVLVDLDQSTTSVST